MGCSGRQELWPGSIPYPQASQQRIGKRITASNIEVMNKVVVENEKGVVALTAGSRLRVGEKVCTSKLVMPGIYAAGHHGVPYRISLCPISIGGVGHIFSEYQTYEVHKGQITGLVFTELRRRHPAMGQRSAISKFDDQHFRKMSNGLRRLAEIKRQPPLPSEHQSLPFSRLSGGQTGICNRIAADFLTVGGKSSCQQKQPCPPTHSDHPVHLPDSERPARS